MLHEAQILGLVDVQLETSFAAGGNHFVDLGQRLVKSFGSYITAIRLKTWYYHRHTASLYTPVMAWLESRPRLKNVSIHLMGIVSLDNE